MRSTSLLVGLCVACANPSDRSPGPSSGPNDAQASSSDAGTDEDASLATADVMIPPPPPSGPQPLIIRSASGPGDAPYLPALAIDGDTQPESRWSAEGVPSALTLDLDLIATVQEVRIAWYQGDQRQAFFDVLASEDGSTFAPLVEDGRSSGNSANFEAYPVAPTNARFIRISGRGNTDNNWNSIREVRLYGEPTDIPVPPPPPPSTGLDPNVPPGSNFELIDWYLNTPADDDGDNRSDRISETNLANGYETPSYFYTGRDGGMVFRVTVGGAKTSANTSYVRTELREMLRRGNTSMSTTGRRNNWVFGSAPSAAQQGAGGVNGKLRATVAVNHVTTTGDSNQVGRVIIGQIHAQDDEPCRLYYRKLPGHSRGSIYYAHEPSGESDDWIELIGSRSSNASDPSDGVALNERFTYEIEVMGSDLFVRIFRAGKPDIVDRYDMSNSGYSVNNEYMYFKAGAYVQDNTGNSDDYAQVTFYELTNTHDGYPY